MIVTSHLGCGLAAMAGLTEPLQVGAVEEQIAVTAVRGDVINLLSDNGASAVVHRLVSTQGLFESYPVPEGHPSRGVVGQPALLMAAIVLPYLSGVLGTVLSLCQHRAPWCGTHMHGLGQAYHGLYLQAADS